MSYAVIKTGGKQYLVTDGETLKVEKLATDVGKKITFDEVLLTATDTTVNVGAPTLAGAKVEGKVTQHGQHDKVTGVKMKAKKRRKKFFGHRQRYTEVQITKISEKASK